MWNSSNQWNNPFMKLTRFPFVAGLVVCLTTFAGSAPGAPQKPSKPKPAAQSAKQKRTPANAEEPPAAKQKPDENPPQKGKEPPAPETEVLTFKKFASAKALVEQLPKPMATARLEAHLTILPTAYVNTIVGVALSPDKKQLFLVAADGSRHLYDDHKAKGHEELLNSADLEDMFIENYPLTNPTDRLPLDFDPGRARPEVFFKTLYGDSPEAVRKNLVNVSFAGKKVLFSKLHGASAALEKVGKELEPALKAKPELRVWLNKLDGTFNWRKIEGTDRLSTHSYGIAIDLNADRAKYWRWEKPATLATFSRRDFPVEIIECFERNGFVWGGKWYHYDTMHFEFRPEILASARLAGGLPPAASPSPAETAHASDKPGKEPGPPDAPPRSRRALLVETAGKPGALDHLRASLDQCGFSVEVLKTPDLARLIESINRFAAAPAGTDVLLLHFSGEAMYRDSKTFLVPHGAAIKSPDDLFAEAAPLDRIIESLKKAGAGTKIVLLDTPPPSASGGADAPAQQFMVPGFFFGFAGSSSAIGPRAWQPGVFTESLATQMVAPKLSLGDMFTMVTQDVNRVSGGTQKPQSFSSLSEIFRFMEAPKADVVPNAPPSQEKAEVKENAPKKGDPPK
jgi:hypothetical protein